ncbi:MULTISPECIES: hypothetical protein [unclassified Micromonospora]|uniref:hypothetical protein n=1 Tax=unclassified Micromonospora TaxID=2617518 RepID=UPI001C240495|nr:MULTISPECIES: hypothetical protein [unclassified Micromonospora]MBU8860447.1 hypothetical protein [Micromonospora sp. WMMB482]MDM4779984.1 hypothetical protein [Micromonospora sp. b486]
MSTATWASGADASALFRTAADRVRAIDVQHIRDALYAPGGSYRWPRHRINEVELEWRRWRLRHHLGLRDEPPASIRLYERLAVSAGVPPADVSPLAGGGPLVDATYDQMFPQGPLIIRAVKSRVVRRPTDHEVDEEYATLLRESSGRRSDYLSMLDPSGYYWHMPDLISAATARECMKDVEVLLAAPRGESFAGGPQPGWDVEHDALVSRSMNAYLGAGPTLIKIHEDPALVAEISAHMGRPMHPTRCTYLRYEKGDYLGVHTDQPTCEVSLLFTIAGDPGPMRSYLDETGHDPAWLDRWVREAGNFPDGGLDFIYQPREGLALTGRAVPHARLPQAERAVIGALFYSGLT